MIKEMITAIIAEVKKNPQHVLDQFVRGASEDENKEMISAAADPNNWSIHGGADRLPGTVEFCFDCEPFDDQLRAYVFLKDYNIVRVRIQGE